MNLQKQIETLVKEAKEASRELAVAKTERKNAVLRTLMERLSAEKSAILKANALDLANGKKAKLSGALLDRLEITESRFETMLDGVGKVMELVDPVGEILSESTTSAGLNLSRVRVPIGVVGIIYESRPVVTVDAAVLCIKTGNAVVLRGGKEAFETNQVLARILSDAMEQNGFARAAVTFIPTTDRSAVPVLCGLNTLIDLMIPRGGRGLIETVVEHARMPVIKHFEGICHVYVHEKADLNMAEAIVLNSKCQRPGVCNSAETLLVDKSIAEKFLPRILKSLRARDVKILADAETSKITGESFPQPERWDKEYLDLILAVRVVNGLDEAVAHIEQYGSHHSDAIVTDDQTAAEMFLMRVDSAAVYWNASTRFTDGYQFGLGAEMGISTDKIHARGPMGLEGLTSYKYIIRGTGQVRE